MSLARQKPVNRRKLSGVDGHTSVNQQGPTLLDLKTNCSEGGDLTNSQDVPRAM